MTSSAVLVKVTVRLGVYDDIISKSNVCMWITLQLLKLKLASRCSIRFDQFREMRKVVAVDDLELSNSKSPECSFHF